MVTMATDVSARQRRIPVTGAKVVSRIAGAVVGMNGDFIVA